MRNTKPLAVPPVEQWATPISWVGPNVVPHDDYSRFFPQTASFVRAEWLFQLMTEVRPGWKEMRCEQRPGIMRVEAVKQKGRVVRIEAVEVHCVGLDGQCWTLRPEKRGKREFWPLFVGPGFPAETPAPAELLAAYPFESLNVQTLVPCEWGRKVILLHLREGFERIVNDGSQEADED